MSKGLTFTTRTGGKVLGTQLSPYFPYSTNKAIQAKLTVSPDRPMESNSSPKFLSKCGQETRPTYRLPLLRQYLLLRPVRLSTLRLRKQTMEVLRDPTRYHSRRHPQQ
jgi:hypothetical protein